MAKQLIPEELNELIQEYLTDGVLTDKERQVILRKAEGMGLDRDEIDLYLDAQVQKIDQTTDAAARKKRGKTCPYCGGSIPQLADKCPHCGENITAEASEELQEIFDNLEEALVDFKSGKDIAKSKATVERFMRKAKMYYGNNPKIQKLLEEVETESLKAEKAAKSNARKNLLAKYWKIIAAAAVVLIVAIGIGIHNLTTEPEIDYWEKQDQIKAQITEKVNEGNLSEAADLAGTLHVSFVNVENVDAIFLKIIKSFIKEDNYDEAEELALVYRTKIDSDLSWSETSVYRYLKSAYKKIGRDFSPLKYKEDKD
jgi:hypothetical protein